ncbi:MAG: IS1 family transposase [Colwellia sp.]|nr:IS1 family transposase [Colwellia sp.]
MRCSECQLDEMWSFIGKKEKNLDAIEKLQGILGDAWIWIAFDAVNKIVLAYVIGKRTLSHAVSLLEEVKRVTAEMPELFSSDQLDHYANALLQVYGHMIIPARKPGAGRPPNPRLILPKNLNYVHVVKEYKENRVYKISHKVIYGDDEKISEILSNSVVSRNINTSYVERNNGTIRHMDARCSRKTYRFSKIKTNHEHQLALSLAYYHLCRPHRMLSKRYNKPTTPFMSADLTDHVWSMEELLTFKPKVFCR